MSTVKLTPGTNGGSVQLKAPNDTSGADVVLTLPNTDGNANQLLKTDGSGNLSWADDTDTTNTNASNLSSGTLPAARIADDSIVEAKLDIHAAPSGTDKFLGYTANGMEWAVPSGGGAFTKIYRKTTTTSTVMNSGNDPVRVGGTSMEITFTPPASTTSYLAHYSGQIHAATDDGQWAPQFRISSDNFSNHTSINFVHNTYGFEDTEKQRRVENWWREFKPGSTSEWKIRIYAEVHGTEGVDITFGGWGGVNALTLYELDDSVKSGDWG
jgi:hypothetical protein